MRLIQAMLFLPTGRGSATSHVGYEIDFGTTLYADAGKKWNVATMMYHDFNQRKTNEDITVGNILTLSGGAGRTSLKGTANAGVASGAQWKITHDSGSDIPAILSINNGRVGASDRDRSSSLCPGKISASSHSVISGWSQDSIRRSGTNGSIYVARLKTNKFADRAWSTLTYDALDLCQKPSNLSTR